MILIVGLCASIAAGAALRAAAEERGQVRFRANAASVVTAIEQKMDSQVGLLRGAAGMFAASEDVDRAAFAAYVDRLQLGQRYPGVLGVGYAERIGSPREAEAIRRRLAAQGLPDFRIWPGGDAAQSAIVYLQPENRLNRAAFGYDMYSQPTRRAAMARARDEGAAVTSGRVLLVQEIEPDKQPGVLIYVPVYGETALPGSVAERRALLQGWVYSPLRAHDLLGTLFPRRPGRGLDVAVHDGAPAAETLLYATGPLDPKARFSTVLPVEVAGRRWNVAIASAPGFEGETGSGLAATLLAIAGVAVTFLLASLALRQARAVAAAERAREKLRLLNDELEARVEARTAALSDANARLVEEARSREAAEAKLVQLQKMEAVGQLTGGIAHDFNNMLSIIIGSLELARRRFGDRDRALTYIGNAEEGARRAAQLTDRLLAFARRKPPAPRALDAAELVSDMLELLQRSLGEQVAVETSLAPDLWPVFADPVQLENAILNLAVNARDAMPDGGRLGIAAANAAHSGDDQLAAGDYVVIAVSDTGFGMSPDVVERVFEPFFTTKAVGQGTGLGLSQVYGFVRQSGGDVRIESVPGEGTSVRLWLPRGEQAAASPTEERVTAPAGDAPAATILVVEDEEGLRKVTVDALRQLGYGVVEAEDARAALAVVKDGGDVDLLFSDVVMPGMNGPELAALAKRHRPSLKVLLTTGYAAHILDGEDATQQRALLSKPFTAEQLDAKIRQVLEA